MIKYVAGIVTILVLQLALNITSLYQLDTKQNSDLIWNLQYYVINGNYLAFPLTGRCSEEKNIKWFKCDKFQQAIAIKWYETIHTRDHNND